MFNDQLPTARTEAGTQFCYWFDHASRWWTVEIGWRERGKDLSARVEVNQEVAGSEARPNMEALHQCASLLERDAKKAGHEVGR